MHKGYKYLDIFSAASIFRRMSFLTSPYFRSLLSIPTQELDIILMFFYFLPLTLGIMILLI
jgi:hypothetical protein